MLKIIDSRRNNMARIPFNVSAKTARLIGRENVSNLEGALIELIKNTYDADVLFIMKVQQIGYS
jgi:hypothetical protein